MKNTLNLSPELSFPLEIAGQTTAIFGLRGSGKTNSAGVLAEELLGHNHQIAVIDPTDAWWGLRAGRDGSESKGYPVFIFGGSHADVPLAETDGKIMAEFLVREQVSIVLSIRHLRKGAQRRFVTEFCEELYHLKGKPKNRTSLTVFIDEAPLFVPQRVMGEIARTVGAVEDLIARGRSSGFGVVLISQRSATLNADVRTQAETIICHRVIAKLDRKAISDWFEENADAADLKGILQSLAGLKNGEAWIWSPKLDVMKRAQVRMRHTFDSSATPKVGEKVRAPKSLTQVDLEKLKGQLAETIKKAKDEDPKELKRRIAELEKSAGKPVAASPAPAPTKIEYVDKPVLKDGQIERFEKSIACLESMTSGLRVELQRIRAGEIQRQPIASPSRSQPVPCATVPKRIEPPVRKLGNAGYDGGSLPPGEAAVLKAACQYQNGVIKKTLSVLTGYKRSSRDAYIARLSAKGLITVSGDRILATDSAAAALGDDYEPLPTGEDLIEYWRKELPDGERAVFEVIVGGAGSPVTRSDIEARTEYKRSTRDAYIARLKARQIIEVRDQSIYPAEALFA